MVCGIGVWSISTQALKPLTQYNSLTYNTHSSIPTPKLQASILRIFKMQFFIVAISALASLAAAAPNYPPPGGECTPPSYQCLSDASGWQVCSAQGQWVVSLPISHLQLHHGTNSHALVRWQLPPRHRVQVLRAQRQPLLRASRLLLPLESPLLTITYLTTSTSTLLILHATP